MGTTVWAGSRRRRSSSEDGDGKDDPGSPQTVALLALLAGGDRVSDVGGGQLGDLVRATALRGAPLGTGVGGGVLDLDRATAR
jgi:hypothetical protein